MENRVDIFEVRALMDSDMGPLRRFTAKLDGLKPDTRPASEGRRESTSALFDLKDLDVKEAVEPYLFPVYQLKIPASNRKKSRWGFLSASAVKILDGALTPDQQNPKHPSFVSVEKRVKLQDLRGKRIGFVVADGIDSRPEPPMLWSFAQQKDAPTPAWMIYEIEGYGMLSAGALTSMDMGMKLLDGKTLQEFNDKALVDPTIRGDIQLMGSITQPPDSDTNFAKVMVNSGLFTVDEQGVYHKK